MKRRLCFFAFALSLGISAHAATYYISPTGSDSNPGSSSQPWATFSHAWTAVHGCDTLIVNDGTYLQEVRPTSQQNGSSSCYTTIQAAHDWGAIVDGHTIAAAFQGALYLASVSYIQVRGIRFAGNPSDSSGNGTEPVMIVGADHIKLIKLAAYNAPCWGNQMAFDIGPGASYVLVEDSHAWGCGRYKFLAYQSDHIIFRHNVSRHDYHDITGWTRPYTGGNISGWGRQCATYTMYDSYDVIMQNNISIDSGLPDDSTGNLYAGIWSENNDVISGHGASGQDNSGKYEGHIFINIQGYWGTPAISDYKLTGTREMSNIAMANTVAGINVGRLASEYSYGPADLLIHHITAYNIPGPFQDAARAAGVAVQNDTAMTYYTEMITKDSVIQKMQYTGIAGTMTSDYNLFYSNSTNYNLDAYQGATPTAGAHDIQGVNPRLKYITRVEPGTPGSGTASDGGDRGATILYRIGTPGTLWGDSGYDTLTSTPLWPWDDEAVIKSDMASYSYVNPVAGGTISGARGFAASGNGLYGGPITLTSYVWEQLGNACPSNICSSASGTNDSLNVGTSGTGSGTISGTNCASGSYASGTSYFCTATANSGSTFAGWTDTCGGTASGSSDSGTITANCTVTGAFNASVSTYSLTVSETGTGTGSVNGTNCASGSYAVGTPVSCTVTPTGGSSFAGWSGVCIGTGACSFTLSANDVVQAIFNASGSALALGLGTCTSSMTGTQNAAFSGCTLAATGGTPPYSYSWAAVTDGSYAALPEGLSLSGSSGAISGTAYGQGRYVPQFVVKDSSGATATLSSLAFSIAGDNTLGGCSLFPSDSIFHQRVDTLPLDTSPAAPINSSYQSASLRVFFGNGGNGNVPNGIPMIRVPYNQANAAVTNTVAGYFTAGPFPPYAPIEATSTNVAGDRHVSVLQTAGGGNPCRLWEMYQGANTGPTTWQDVGNAYWSNLGSTGAGAYAMLPQDTGSTDAAGLPIAPLLVNADEVIGTGTPSAPSGSVLHPIRFTVNHMLNRYVWPATAHAGTGTCSGGYSDNNSMILQGAGAPTSCTMTGPSGEIYRLKTSAATPACAATSPQAAIIIQGMRSYGIILADNGTTGGLIGTPDSRWNDNDLACLSQLTLSEFEPVDVSGVAAVLTPNYNSSSFSAPVTSYQTVSSALTGIVVAPATASIAAGTGTQQYAAQCSYASSGNADCTSTVTWSSSAPSVATISSGGLASGVSTGSSTIKAASGSISGTAVLTVTAGGGPTLTGITVTPATASIVAGTGTQQYGAQCAYSNSTIATCTSTVTWSSSAPSVATISSGGLVSGVAAGNSTIKAASGSISGTAVLTVTTSPVNPTSGFWIWMGGSDTVPATNQGRPGVYNTLRVPSLASAPGGREASVTWTDNGGNLWLFGGGGFDSSGLNGYLNDLWEFLPSTEQWVWMGGSNTVPGSNKGQPGVYGTIGAAATANSPGGREAAAAWVDKSGNFWLSGGLGFDAAGTEGSLNDLWEFSASTHNWAWIAGGSTVPAANQGQPGVFGQLGVSATANIPGGRWGASSWTDTVGNLWLFGGTGYDSAGSLGSLNDLWEFDPSTRQWAWMGGSSTVGTSGGQPGVYGSLGIQAATNVPSGRSQSVSWTDSSGNFWLFGGKGYDSAGVSGYLNDLWEFDPAAREWAWMGGSNTISCAGCGNRGVYGNQGQASAANSPGGRDQAVAWTDSKGNLWLLGGNGFDSAGTFGLLNDLWEFLPATQEWAWMGGNSTVPGANQGQHGVYGQLRVQASGGSPGGRWGAGAWADKNGNLWLFGGTGIDSAAINGVLNDLWVYEPASGSLAAATPTLSPGAGTYNASQTVTINDAMPGATIYYTTNGTSPGTSSNIYTTPITVSSTMTINAVAIAKGYQTSAMASATYTLTPSFKIALQNGSATSVTVNPGSKATFNLVVTPVGSPTLIASVTLSATGMPPGSTVTFTPATIAAGMAATNVSLTIQTSSTVASVTPRPTNWIVALCVLLLPLAGARRRRAFVRELRTGRWLLPAILLLAALTVAISGCASVVFKNTGSGTPTQYPVTVTATGGAVQQTATVTVVLQ